MQKLDFAAALRNNHGELAQVPIEPPTDLGSKFRG